MVVNVVVMRGCRSNPMELFIIRLGMIFAIPANQQHLVPIWHTEPIGNKVVMVVVVRAGLVDTDHPIHRIGHFTVTVKQ